MQEQQHKELENLKAELQRKADLTGEQAEIARLREDHRKLEKDQAAQREQVCLSVCLPACLSVCVCLSLCDDGANNAAPYENSFVKKRRLWSKRCARMRPLRMR